MEIYHRGKKMCLATHLFNQNDGGQVKDVGHYKQHSRGQSHGYDGQNTSAQQVCGRNEPSMPKESRTHVLVGDGCIKYSQHVRRYPNNNINNNKGEKDKVEKEETKNDIPVDKGIQDLQKCLRIQQVKPVDLQDYVRPRSLFVNGAKLDPGLAYMKNGSITVDCKQLEKGLSVQRGVLTSNCKATPRQTSRYSSCSAKASITSGTTRKVVQYSPRIKTAGSADCKSQRTLVYSARVVGEAVQGHRRPSILSGTERKKSIVNFTHGGRRRPTLRLVRYLETGPSEVRS